MILTHLVVFEFLSGASDAAAVVTPPVAVGGGGALWWSKPDTGRRAMTKKKPARDVPEPIQLPRRQVFRVRLVPGGVRMGGTALVTVRRVRRPAPAGGVARLGGQVTATYRVSPTAVLPAELDAILEALARLDADNLTVTIEIG